MEAVLWLLALVVAIYVGYYFRTKKEASMKKAFGMGCLSWFVMLVIASGIIYASMSDEEKAKQEVGQSTKLADSSATDKVNESVGLRVERQVNTDSILDVMRKEYTFKKDEFDEYGRTWVHSHAEPRFRNKNAFYCYFQINDDKSVSNFRFVMQYEDDDWLFIENCVFNVDGENIRFVPSKMERDNDSRIWEWFDEQITSNNVNLIRKIANAKTVKVKLNGKQYYDTRTIKSKEISSIKKTLYYYEELGGIF